jgi:N-acetyl-1-D-myo-inositol-2-amino-2-deoxy-alpha-D-glucopyranoside deacetylase
MNIRFPKDIKTFIKKHRYLIIVSALLWALWMFGLGALGGWLLSKGSLQPFPQLTPQDRVLILAPHIDDESISSAGLIQEALRVGAAIKIVYATNGDENLASLMHPMKRLDLSPESFVSLGETRMTEAIAAMSKLGIPASSLLFLGFPDQGLTPMLLKNYSEQNPFISPGTRFTFNPYANTYHPNEVYAGVNVDTDLKEIVSEFKPTIVVVSHPRDKHPDHRALYQYLEHVKNELPNLSFKTYTYLVHYPLYPPQKEFAPTEFLYPPKKLFTPEGWFSYDLSANQEGTKLQAINEYHTQLKFSLVSNFLRSFVKRNEIFEVLD